MSSTSRRSFLRQAAAFSTLGAAGPLGLSLATMGQASAQSANCRVQIVTPTQQVRRLLELTNLFSLLGTASRP